MHKAGFVHGLMAKTFSSVDALRNRLRVAIAEALVSSITKKAMQLGLVDSGLYAGSFRYLIDGDRIVITNQAKYANALEWGTYEMKIAFGNSYPDPALPKKKDSPVEVRLSQPKGVQPFGTVRRILYSPHEMQEVLKKALASL